MASTVPVAAPARAILPARGTARVKNVLSGDTVILLGKAPAPNARAPEVVFTLESVSAPRYVILILVFVGDIFVFTRWTIFVFQKYGRE